MNLKRMERALRAMVDALRSDDEDEDNLILWLMAILDIWFRDRKNTVFYRDFLGALEESFLEKLIKMVGEDAVGDYRHLLDAELDRQTSYLNGFVSDLSSGSLSEAQARARASRYAASLGEFEERVAAEMENDKSKPYKWVYSESVQDHCTDCIELDGQVHPLSWFIATNHIPKSDQQECHAHCQCRLEPT